MLRRIHALIDRAHKIVMLHSAEHNSRAIRPSLAPHQLKKREEEKEKGRGNSNNKLALAVEFIASYVVRVYTWQ